MYGPKLFMVVFQKGVYQKPIPCVSPKSISLPSFLCGCTPVIEIREFNQKKKKKMNNLEKSFSTPFP